MAKIRVYEFARDLNMTNRELLDRIRDLDIDVNSHMSSLDEDVVAMVKSALFGEQKDDQLEEMRVRPTVIRRRKVVAPPVPETDAPAEGDAEEAGEEAADEADVAAKAQPESPLPEPVEESPAVVETQPPPEKDAAVTKRKRAEAAKVIAKPESVVPEESPAPAKTEPEVVDVVRRTG
jgi:translation initiation factor IF-2